MAIAQTVLTTLSAMNQLSRDQLKALMSQVLTAQGKVLPEQETANLREIGFRSLDFSELALRVEDEIDTELNFEAAGLREIATVADVLNLLEEIQAL